MCRAHHGDHRGWCCGVFTFQVSIALTLDSHGAVTGRIEHGNISHHLTLTKPLLSVGNISNLQIVWLNTPLLRGDLLISPTNKLFWSQVKNIFDNFPNLLFPLLFRPDNTRAFFPTDKVTFSGSLSSFRFYFGRFRHSFSSRFSSHPS